MIITKLSHFSRYVDLNPYFKDLGLFIEESDMSSFQEGPLDILGEFLYGNCFRYVADGTTGDFFEGHHNYIDVHVVVENTECIAVTSADKVVVRDPYDVEIDAELYDGVAEQVIQLQVGDCIILFPEDLHQPKIRVNDLPVKKVVFKVAVF
ncbi:beta-D-galactosidase [Streptococcus cuniculi]|uniref:Beta-D-galactosidase n=1 Tax=Streptococcus cuniculi TaxID=1432788 RepID=A0A1Q8E5V3_9STRE|nr:YhcH/YjgK/YiaL family protein [Streptococcus cuniculi]OLF47173.1 beta-D-galactosidase [Streptococcus cuniculi]